MGIDGGNGGFFNAQYLPDVDMLLGVRPALKLDLSKVEFNSATKTFSAIGQTVSVTNVNLEPSTPQTIAVGEVVSFTASISPNEATDKTVKWRIGGTDAGALTLYSDPACKYPLGSDATETMTVYAKGSSTGNAIVTCFSNSDSAKFASCEVTVNTLQTQIEEVLTTITATGAMQANFSTENVASLDLLKAQFNEVSGWNGTDMKIEVTPCEGYTITRCVFYDDSYHIATDSVAPFKVETQHLASTPYVNGEPIYEGSNGIKKIDVIGYYTGNSVTITPGSNMTKTLDSGDALQNGLSGAMTAVVYTADDGYYFPTGYNVEDVNGISVTRDSYTQITVSGTPTADAAITLAEPTAKTKPDAPAVSAVNCTTAANNDGKLTGVTAAMEYKKSDATNWTVGTGNDITGLVPGTYYVRLKATDTMLVSDNQELVISAYTVPGQVVAPVFNPAAGTYTEAQSVTISCSTTGADIYYTTNGNEPTTSSTKYTGAISISATTTVKAIAVKSGMTNSAVASAVYTIKTSPVITKAPEAITGLVYNGKAQALITAGEVTGGTLYYAVVKAGDAEPSAELYTTSIPTAINAGSYYVWYKVDGGDNHNDINAEKIDVKIDKSDTIPNSPSETMVVDKPSDKTADVILDKQQGTTAPVVKKEGTILSVDEIKAEVVVTFKAGKDPTVTYTKTTDNEAKSVVVSDNVTVDGVTYEVSSVGANSFNGSDATTVTLGKNIKKMAPKALNGSKIKTVVLRTTKLTKKSVKNAFKGSKAKKIVIKVKVGSKKLNKKYVKKYKKIFTKKNVGVKVVVK
ncbi:MAG: hypothetical protein E7271_01060 [Lachnospiraceae bacterium]|nr:hypothetical protein [Lachnospiraceae bacterium]